MWSWVGRLPLKLQMLDSLTGRIALFFEVLKTTQQRCPWQSAEWGTHSESRGTVGQCDLFTCNWFCVIGCNNGYHDGK